MQQKKSKATEIVPEINAGCDDFGLILNCAVRYALGRETYMPSAVCSFIKPLIQNLTGRTIVTMIQDIEEPLNRNIAGERAWGDPDIDKPEWMELLGLLKEEQTKRNQVDTGDLSALSYRVRNLLNRNGIFTYGELKLFHENTGVRSMFGVGTNIEKELLNFLYQSEVKHNVTSF